ncbi:MAG: glutathione synthase [Candidatus Aceula lacicola]|nr:glutathione synthase [Candidatus Aceula lacicola]
MNFVFLMDPLETIKIEKDTTFALMLCAYFRNHRTFFLSEGNISIKEGKVSFKVTEVVPQKDADMPFVKKETSDLLEDNVDVVFIRTDPPFDESYLMSTWLLDRLPKRVAIINSPNGIRTVNEKLWATQFTSIVPKTLVTRNKDEFIKFLDLEKEVIIKPVNLFGGISIFHIRKGDLNAHVAFETLSNSEKHEVIVQKYVNDAKVGDKRILLLDGEPLGALLRVHAQDDHRNNFFSGGYAKPIDITAKDQRIIELLKPHLRSLGLYFVGIDIIGDYLIEVNVTSPTCLQEMNRFYHQALEDQVINFAEELTKKYQGSLS